MSHPKGKLIAIGGSEDKGTDLEKGEIHRNNLNFFELGILRRLIDEAGGNMSRIEVITTASMIPNEVGDNYLNAFGKIGCINVGVIHIRNRYDAMQEDCLERIKKCDAVMFSGGNQMRLTITEATVATRARRLAACIRVRQCTSSLSNTACQGFMISLAITESPDRFNIR